MAHVGEDDAGGSVGAPPPDMSSAAAALRSAGAEVAQVRVEASSEPWTPTGLAATRGALITWLANGNSWIGVPEGSPFGAGFQLRLRTGMRGPVLSGTGATFTTAMARSRSARCIQASWGQTTASCTTQTFREPCSMAAST